MKEIIITKFFILIFLIASVGSDNCKISWMETGHQVAESQYVVQLSITNTTGDLRTYFPNTYYDITIKSKQKNRTFTQFYFTMLNLNKTKSYGTLYLLEKDLSTFHNGPFCINRVIDGPVSLAKLSIKIGWQSPPVNSGCIKLRAAIMETELRYHTANVTICQDPRVELDDPGEILKNCCVCEDGKYELAFEGLWSRYTHPKNFPRREWLAVFPTIIGASHRHDYEFWKAYTDASNGLKRYAETGYTVALELELKANKTSIGTLIKFRGVNFQNKTRKSYAYVRVSQEKHVVSLVSKIDPSPDWFIGISSLELCRPDCSWAKSKTLNLYAYDAGIRDGILYEDLDGVTDPPDIIQSLNMSWPLPRNGIEAPFYDATNNTHDVRPLARIHFTLLRGADKQCQSINPEEECTTDWSQWSNCSVNCGHGIQSRTRTYIEPFNKDSCSQSLIEHNNCYSSFICEKEITEQDCVLGEWGEWSKCESMCGFENKQRSRDFKWTDKKEKCIAKFVNIILEEKKDCGNPPCPENDGICDEDRYNPWMDWTPCSVTQGNGNRVRYRTVKEYLKKVVKGNDMDYGNSICLYQSEDCIGDEILEDSKRVEIEKSIPKSPPIVSETPVNAEIPAYCLLPMDEGECLDNHDNSHKYYYNHTEQKCVLFRFSGCKGNENRFNDLETCTETCVIHGKRVDCELENWTEWTRCSNCNDIQLRERKIKVHPKNGGRPCRNYSQRVHRRECRKELKNCN